MKLSCEFVVYPYEMSIASSLSSNSHNSAFFVQSALILIVVVTALVNLTIGTDHINFWSCILSSCLGYILPNPKIKSSNSLPL